MHFKWLFLVIFIPIWVFAAKPVYVSKTVWLKTFQKNFLTEMCSDTVKMNRCYGKTLMDCNKEVKGNLSACIKTSKISSKIPIGRYSEALGEKLGVCVGHHIEKTWKYKGDEACIR